MVDFTRILSTKQKKSLVKRLVALICVSKKGEKISEKDFDRFYRIEKSRTRKTGGVGLDLSVVKSIVSPHVGKIEVTSTSENITTISILIHV